MDPELQKPLLRKRGQPQAPGHDNSLAGQSQTDLVNRLVADYSLQPPPRCLQCLEASGWLLQVAAMILRVMAPFVISFCQVMYQIYRLIPKEELKVLYGLALCFFGGEFCASIAAVECFRRTGGDKLLLCLQDLGTNIQVANQASLEDDKALGVDISSYTPQEMRGSVQEWYRHKTGVVLKAVDPDVLVKALAGLYQGFLGMLMSLKFKFAWTVALACSIADRLRKPVAIVVTPVLVVLLPKDYHKWINQIINLSLKALAVHLAWKLQEVISAVQSGLLGASLVGTGVILITIQGFSWASGGRCCKRKFNPDESILDELIGLPLAAAGIWFQLKHGFSMPFPYNLALLPLSIVESVLRFMVTWFPVEETAFPSHR
eukprot:s117_g11.t1